MSAEALPDSRDRLAVGFVMPPWQVRIRQPAAIFISELTEIVRNGWVEEYFWELQNPYLDAHI